MKKFADPLEISFASEVENLIYECYPNPLDLGITLYAGDKDGNEVFCNDPEISPINCRLELLTDAGYISFTELDNDESIDAFPDHFFDCLFFEWFYRVGKKADGERLPFRIVYDS